MCVDDCLSEILFVCVLLLMLCVDVVLVMFVVLIFGDELIDDVLLLIDVIVIVIVIVMGCVCDVVVNDDLRLMMSVLSEDLNVMMEDVKVLDVVEKKMLLNVRWVDCG